MKTTRQALEAVAFQIGVLIAVERNRRGLTQAELAAAIRADRAGQAGISRIENGQPTTLTDSQVDRVFSHLNLRKAAMHAAYLKWWREHGPKP